MKNNRLLVCGGEEYEDKEVVFAVLSKLYDQGEFNSLVCRGKNGTGRWVEEWSNKHVIGCIHKEKQSLRNLMKIKNICKIVVFPQEKEQDLLELMAAIEELDIEVISVVDPQKVFQ